MFHGDIENEKLHILSTYMMEQERANNTSLPKGELSDSTSN